MGSFVDIKEFVRLKELVFELQARVQSLEGGAEPEAAKPAEPIPSIEKAMEPGLGEFLDATTVTKLEAAGYGTVAAVNAASDSDLEGVTGIGAATVSAIRSALED